MWIDTKFRKSSTPQVRSPCLHAFLPAYDGFLSHYWYNNRWSLSWQLKFFHALTFSTIGGAKLVSHRGTSSYEEEHRSFDLSILNSSHWWGIVRGWNGWLFFVHWATFRVKDAIYNTPLIFGARAILLCTSPEYNFLLIFVPARRNNKRFLLWLMCKNVESNYDAVRIT